MRNFKLYNPTCVNSNKDCSCGYCAVYPELFHAMPYSITPYRNITSMDEAKSELLNFPNAVIIEFDNSQNHYYINHSTGKTWEYNGSEWGVQDETLGN